MMENLQNIAQALFSVNSVWSIILRGTIWTVMSLVILVATDNPDTEQSVENVKSYLGFFLIFIVVSTSLIYLLFGFVPV
jgi:hypothetical protein